MGIQITGIQTTEPSRQERIRVNTDLNALTQVLEWFEQFNPPALPNAVWLQCQLALAEGFTNAVRHAHKGKSSDTPIDIEVTCSPHSIELRIWDSGEAFDMEKNLALPQAQEPEPEGGWGLSLLQKIADVLLYTRTEHQQNCLLIVKQYPCDLNT